MGGIRHAADSNMEPYLDIRGQGIIPAQAGEFMVNHDFQKPTFYWLSVRSEIYALTAWRQLGVEKNINLVLAQKYTVLGLAYLSEVHNEIR